MAVMVAVVVAAALVLVGGCAASGPGTRPDKQSADGEQIPILDLEVIDVENNTVHRLAEHGNRPLLVYFFTTWCVPCVEDMNLLLDLNRRYESDGLQIVGVAMDLDAKLTVPTYVDYWQIPFPVYGATEDLVQGQSMLGRLSSLPLSLFVDRRGRLVASHPGNLPPDTTEKAVLGLLKIQ